MKILTFILLITTFLNAQAATDEQLNSIYKEAILFVAIFGVMGIISFIYSKRHAKAYVAPKVVVELTPYQLACQERIQELTKMLDDEIITEDEFELLKDYYRI